MSPITPKRVLQIGWRPKGTRALKRLGCQVDVLATAGQIDEGLDDVEVADRVLQIENFMQIETLVYRVAREIDAGETYDAVIGFDEYTLLPTSFLAEHLGLPRLDSGLILRMRDKSHQKSLIRKARLACAEFVILEDVLHATPPVFPFILKPVAGAGTNTTFRINDSEGWASALASIRATPGKRSFLAERVIEGREYHFDGYILDGEIKSLDIGRYLANIIEIRNGALCGSFSLSSEFERGLYSTTRKWLTQVLHVLGHLNGVFHVEAFLSDQGWIFSEAAMRVGGGGISVQHENVFGLDLFQTFAEVSLCLPVTPARKWRDHLYHGWVYLPSDAGTILSYPLVTEIQLRNGGRPVEISLPPGTKVGSRADNSVVRIGVACLCGHDLNALESEALKLAGWFLSQVKVTNRTENKQ